MFNFQPLLKETMARILGGTLRGLMGSAAVGGLECRVEMAD